MKTPYIITSLAEAFKEVENLKPLFCDTETCGLYGKIRLLQLYQEDWDSVILVEWPDPLELLANLVNVYHVWHNAHYDITTIKTQSGMTNWTPVVESYADTLYLARLALPQHEKFSLDEVLQYALGYDPYDRQGLNKKVLQKSDWSKYQLTSDQYLYAATDVYYMPQVWKLCEAHLDDFSYKLDMLTMDKCLQFQYTGMPLDYSKLNEKYEANLARLEEIALPINANSWQQVRKYLDSTESDGHALAVMELQGNEKAAAVREVRKLRKQNSFIDKFRTDDAERIYGKFLPSTRSGRLASKDQNLQQLPRALKGCFGVEEDKVLIYADYAQLELRTICAITRCKTMEELFRSGADLHSYTAEMIFGADYKKSDRQVAKTANFSLLYGGGIGMYISILIDTVGILLTDREANQVRQKWRRLWSEIYGWQEKGIAAWRKGKLGSTPLGRRYKAKMMTDQLNIENQGAGAEVAKLALHYFWPELQKYPEAQLCNFIHDSFIIEAPNDPEIYEPLAKALANSMNEAWFELSKLFNIKDLPMPVDVAVGHNWGDIENDEVEDLWNYQLDGMALYNAKV